VPVHLVDHPLVHDALMELRDARTLPPQFLRAANRISVLLAAASLAPALYSAGWIYLAGAAAGGALFLRYGWRLMRRPDGKSAMACFHASLAQLSILLVAAMLDGALRA